MGYLAIGDANRMMNITEKYTRKVPAGRHDTRLQTAPVISRSGSGGPAGPNGVNSPFFILTVDDRERRHCLNE